MTAPAGGFHLFPEFPTEIRLLIWRSCLPCRIVELDQQQDDLIWDEDESPCAANWKITYANKAPPTISRVCRESRTVALESGCAQPLPDPNNRDAQPFSNSMVDRPWLDTVHDSIHLNWEPFADIEWQSYDWGDPVRCLMWYAARTRSRQASIMLGFLQTFQHRENADQPHEHHRWTRSELADLMRTQTSWTVIILPPVIVHTDTKTAAGLFGLLTDARVQVVDADDEVKIKRFLALTETSHGVVGTEIEEASLRAAKDALRDAVKAIFGSEGSAPTMSPAVMFRLCTENCI